LSACVKTAYAAIASRTLKKINMIDGAPNTSESLKIDAKRLLEGRLISLKDRTSIPIGDHARFDQWHRDTCRALSELFSDRGYKDDKGHSRFTVGHGQKWINMSLKFISLVENRIVSYEDIYDLSHAPIDNRVLVALRKLKPSDFQVDEDYREFCKLKSKGCPLGRPEGWSSFNDYDKYLTAQKWLRQSFSVPPLDVEHRAWLDEDVSGLLRKA
jgi:hypothetical protein